MKVVLTDTGPPVIVESRDFSTLLVEAPADATAESIVASLGQLGTFDGTHAWLRANHLRAALALDTVDDALWGDMVSYAVQRGWATPDASTLRSHLVRG